MAVFSLEDIVKAQATARRLALTGWQRFCAEQPSQLMRICNGIGAEWAPAAIRKVTDALHPTMKVPCMIHDYDYHMGTGTDEDFKAANLNLRANGIRIAKDVHPWYSLLRYKVIRDACRFCKVCRLFGRKAYDDAVRQRTEGLPG